jgi:hypothetical protein
MGDDLAAANVNRSYQLAASSIAIFTFLLLPVSEVRERPSRRLAVSNHVDRDGCGDIFIRVRVLLLLRRLAWRPNRP